MDPYGNYQDPNLQVPQDPTLNNADTLDNAINGVTQMVGQIGSILAYEEQAKLREQQQKRLTKREADLGSYFNKEFSTPYTDTFEGQSLLGSLSKQYDKGLDAVKGSTVKSGATAEAQVGAKGKMLDSYASALSGLAGQGSKRKQQLGYQYKALSNDLFRQQDALDMQEIESWANLINNMSSGAQNYGNVHGQL